MSYRLKREVVDGIVNISLGMPEADAYLKFVRDRCWLNTLLSYGYDLQVFLNSIQKPVLEITPLDILAFIESQKVASNVLKLNKVAYRKSNILPKLSLFKIEFPTIF